MLRLIKTYLADEDGAITVDWVVLTAAVVGLMFGALTVFLNGMADHADLTAQTISAQKVAHGF